MSIKLVWDLIWITPMVLSLVLGTDFAACASEGLEPPASSTSEELEPLESFTTNATQLSSEPIELALPNAREQIAAENTVVTPVPVFQPWADDVVVRQWSVSSVVLPEIDEINESVEVGDRVKHFQVQPVELNQVQIVLDTESQPIVESSTQDLVDIADSEITDFNFTPINTSEIDLEVIQISPEDYPSHPVIGFIPLSSPESMPSADSDRSIAQVAPESTESEPTESEPELIPEEVDEPAAPRWRFTLQPYGFVPLSIEGDATVRDFTSDIDLGLGDILSTLSFAAAGRFEAWRGNLGFVFDAAYFSVENDSSTSRSVPDCLDCIFPSEIDTETKVRYGQFDLGVGYRFASVDPAEAVTEFDLGPVVFDAIVGMRIYAIQGEIDISTNLDTSRELERSKTIFEPLVSGRIRWNISPTVAGWARGDIAGFGIEGMTFSAALTGALEWMFSGNTSLLLGYRVSSIEYTSDQDLELDLLLHGPYLGAVFRF